MLYWKLEEILILKQTNCAQIEYQNVMSLLNYYSDKEIEQYANFNMQFLSHN